MQADFSAIQFHADQALLAQQLAETSTARARALRTRLVAKLRRLYESDHKRAAASAFAVDEATTIALEGLLGNPAPLTDDRSTFLIDQLLLHANPDVFESGHPSTSASRAALTASTRAPPALSVSSSSAEIVEVEPGSPMVIQPATPSHGGSDDGEDEIDEEPDSGKRRADSDYPSGDESDSDDDAGYQD